MSGLEFDDILLVPKLSKVISREDVDLSIKLSDYLTLQIPVIASPMKGIVGTELIIKIAELGGIGILHRFHKSFTEFDLDLTELYRTGKVFGVAVGLGGEMYYKDALEYDSSIICIDVANGYLKSVLEFVTEVSNYISKYNYKCMIMAGNVVTSDGARNLSNCGADLIRVGIGNGGLCTTRNVTGVGRPQVDALVECKGKSAGWNWLTISDGGIKESGDAVKALAIGADLVMLGSLLGQTYESSNSGKIYGMASRRLQEEYYHTTKSIEGIEKVVNKKMSLEDFILEFTYGIKSACTYLDSRHLTDLKRSKFCFTGKGSIKR